MNPFDINNSIMNFYKTRNLNFYLSMGKTMLSNMATNAAQNMASSYLGNFLSNQITPKKIQTPPINRIM